MEQSANGEALEDFTAGCSDFDDETAAWLDAHGPVAVGGAGAVRWMQFVVVERGTGLVEQGVAASRATAPRCGAAGAAGRQDPTGARYRGDRPHL
ncbi:hypothetical protein ABZ897_60400 [Nonomuraea sp. NPDC046802]|uniref:hypothetical protein n=1 Tax=Nonomuraea sp. NPDC046802 TaxID=3154919 RepID=UPI0033EC3C3B